MLPFFAGRWRRCQRQLPLSRPIAGSSRRIGSRRHLRSRKNDQGLALAAAVAISFVVVLLSAAALTQSVNSVTQAGIANHQVSSTDAAEAGVQVEINNIGTSAKANSSTFPCPSGNQVMPQGSSTYRLTGGYSLAYSSASGQTTPTATPAACTGTISLSANTSYLIQATGTTASTSSGPAVDQVLVYVPTGATYAPSGQFPEAIYAAQSATCTGNVTVSTGDVYGGSINCSGNDIFGGQVFASGYSSTGTAVTNSINGNASAGRNLYENGTTTISGNNNIGGILYSTGAVNITGNPVISGDVQTIGNFTSSGNETINGNIVSGGNVSISGTNTFPKSIYASGNVTLGSYTTVDGNVYAGGTVTLNGAKVNGTVYSSTRPSPQTLTTAQVTTQVNAAFATEAALVNPSYNSSTNAYPFPQVTFDPTAWQDNTSFCPAATTSAPCVVVSANGGSAGPYCNIRYSTTPANAMCIITDNVCGSSGVSQLLANMQTSTALPTVIQTNCEVAGGSLALYNNLAVFDSNGFALSQSQITAGTGSPNLYLIVPYGAVAATSNSVAQCSGSNGPDISMANTPTDTKVGEFLYTPNTVCVSSSSSYNGGTATVTGSIYAGQQVTVYGNFTDSFLNVPLWTSSTTNGSTGGAGTPAVQWIKRT